jgi:hypothetical protein
VSKDFEWRLQANALIETSSLPNVGLKFTENGVFGNYDQVELADNATLQEVRQSNETGPTSDFFNLRRLQ